MRFNIVISSLAFFLALATAGHAITVEEAISRFQGRMYSAGKLQGTISWTSSSGAAYSGEFKYMSPGMINVKFTSPSGKSVVCNGKKLWIYDNGSNICGVQDVGGVSGGIAGIVNGYSGIATGGGGGYTLKLKSESKAYPEIVLNLDSTFMLKRATFKDRSGNSTSFTLTVRDGGSVFPGMFNFAIPSNAQVINNPLDIR